MHMPTLLLLAGLAGSVSVQTQFETDSIPTAAGALKITFIGHGSLMFTFGSQVVHVDPYGKLADYAKLPKADLVLITHGHPDHLDPAALRLIRSTNTAVILAAECASKAGGGTVMNNGDTLTVQGIAIEAVPAYNIVHTRGDGQPFHPKGAGNGYILTFGGKRIYIAGDTETIPEMKALTGIDVAFLPMNLPYTMAPGMAADAARAFKPGILYPYHYGDTDAAKLKELLKDAAEIDVRIRRMK